MKITLTPEIEAGLRESANRHGVSPEILAFVFLRARFLSFPGLLEPQDEWERGLRAIGKDCGVSLSNETVSSQGIYD